MSVCYCLFFPAGSNVLSSLGLCMAAYFSFYPIVLIFPFTLISYKVMLCYVTVLSAQTPLYLLHNRYKLCVTFFSNFQQSNKAGVVKFILCVLFWSSLLLFISRQLTGSWDFIEAVYGVM